MDFEIYIAMSYFNEILYHEIRFFLPLSEVLSCRSKRNYRVTITQVIFVSFCYGKKGKSFRPLPKPN